MKLIVRRCLRIVILVFLCLTVCTPIVLVSKRLKHVSYAGRKEFIEDLSTIKYRADAEKLSALGLDDTEDLKEPLTVLYKDEDLSAGVSYSSSNDSLKNEESSSSRERARLTEINETFHEAVEDNQQERDKNSTSGLLVKEQSNRTSVSHEPITRPQARSPTDEKVKQIRDQLIRARAYLNFAPPNSNSHLVKELKLRIKELERAIGDTTKDSALSRGALQKMRAMEATLLKASHIYTDCSAMATRLRAMTYNVEEQVRAQQNQATYLIHLAGRTTPKGHHCLSMHLTAEYFAVSPEKRELPGRRKLQDPDLYHYAVFSDNVMACAVVVNSTVSASMDSKKIVFHVVTDSLNLAAISMWFLLNPPGNASIQIQSIDDFEALSSKHGATLKQQNTANPRYSSELNHLRFYLPDVFPMLKKVLLLDHDVVVQRDLTKLWSVDMKGKVNGAVQTCVKGEPSYHQMDVLINFSDPWVAKKFESNVCTWAFGMNMFDLVEWRRRNISALYHKYSQMGHKKQLWKAGSLPLGWVTFYNQTIALDRRWHLLGLGSESGVSRADIDRAAVIHYDGLMKPWLEIGIASYKGYWSKHVNYNHPYLQQCNIHQ